MMMIVMVVIVMVMSGESRAGKHHQQQNGGKNLFHGQNVARYGLQWKRIGRGPHQTGNGVALSAFRHGGQRKLEPR